MRRLELFAGATALALATSVPARAQSSVTLRIGTVPQDSGSQCFYGRDTGIFAKHGIDSAVEAMSSGPAVAAAVLSGSLDIGFSNVFSLEAAHDKGPAIHVDCTRVGVRRRSADIPTRRAKGLNGPNRARSERKDRLNERPQEHRRMGPVPFGSTGMVAIPQQ